MPTKRIRFVVLIACVVMLAVGISPRFASATHALSSAEELAHEGVTILYPGRLDDEEGQPVADGAYDFAFALYDTQTGGEPLWSEVQEGVAVKAGTFNALLGSVEPIPSLLLDSGARWLAVGVRGPKEADFTDLTPRQRLSAAAPTSSASLAAGPACEHDHIGEIWSASSGDGLWLKAPGSNSTGLHAEGSDAGVAGAGTGKGIWGHSAGGFGVLGSSYIGVGIKGESVNGRVALFEITNVNNSSNVLEVKTNGSGNTIYAEATGSGNAIYVAQYGTGQAGFFGINNTGSSSHALYATTNGSGRAGYFQGTVEVTGYLHKTGGGFRIDHPLTPENKYLNHSFVESPDMKNIYDGVVILNADGTAWVELPEWFEALNSGPEHRLDFRYQLTPIGGPGPNLYIAQEIQGNRFQIAGGTPGLKVSWQVTGIRHDPYAEAHRLPVEEIKPLEERGTYLHPVEHGQPETLGVHYQQGGNQMEPGAGGEP